MKKGRDVLSLQSDVAQSIAEKVEVTVTGKERARLVAARHLAPEVYENLPRVETERPICTLDSLTGCCARDAQKKHWDGRGVPANSTRLELKALVRAGFYFTPGASRKRLDNCTACWQCTRTTRVPSGSWASR